MIIFCWSSLVQIRGQLQFKWILILRNQLLHVVADERNEGNYIFHVCERDT